MNGRAVCIERLAVIGVGLIGGSLARALKQAGAVAHVTGIGRDAAHLERARALGVVDEATTSLAEGVARADVVAVCVPMGAYDAVFRALAEAASETAVITDAGSTKRHALVAARRHLDAGRLARFVPAHPIAGGERSGVEASRADLFAGHWCVLTPTGQTAEDATALVETMWRATGARVTTMDAGDHDAFLAAVSHLPHLAAYALVNAVRKQGDEAHDPFRFAAGGFRDFTRIASSSPVMWRDIALANRDALLAQLAAYRDELESLNAALEAGDGEALLAAFSAAKQARDDWLARKDGGHG